ncbi:MAG: metallophosphoesterase [Bacteroidia bacterium]
MNKFSFLLIGLFLICGWIPAAFSQYKLPDEAFSFAITGDHTEGASGRFDQIIAGVSLIGPAFMIQNGNMIAGKTTDTELLRQQWQAFRQQIRPLDGIQFFPVPGTRDVSGKDGNIKVQKIYQEQWGSLYYSFDYKNAHFIVLHSNDSTEANIAALQTNWLTHDLIKNQEKDHIFVFVHHPATKLRNATEMHRLFAEYGVSAVFCGHAPGYEYSEKDGIAYVMTNGSGKSGFTDNDFFLLVSVRDQSFRIALIASNGVVAPFPPKE